MGQVRSDATLWLGEGRFLVPPTLQLYGMKHSNNTNQLFNQKALDYPLDFLHCLHSAVSKCQFLVFEDIVILISINLSTST